MDVVDVKEMFEEGGKTFDLLFAEENDESDGEYHSQISEIRKISNKGSEAMKSIDTFSVKIEGKKGEEISFGDVYVDMFAKRTPETVKKRTNQDLIKKVMDKSVIVPGFEQLESVPSYEISRKQKILERRKKRDSSKGENWFNMPAVEMTEELKNDLEVLKMRSVLDPKQFYKKNVITETPKYFHVGTVVESPADFYSSRIPKKQRKQTMVDELLANADFQRYNKQRYKEIIEDRKKTSFKAYRHANRLKRKGKSRK